MTKRLLCILSGMNIGGAETFLMKLYRNLDRSRYQMDFCINNPEKQFYEEEILSLGGKLFRVPNKSDNIIAFRQGLFHVIHENNYKYVLRITSNAMGFLDLKIAREAGAIVCAARSSNAGGDNTFKASLAHIVGRTLYGKYVNRMIAPSDLAAIYTFGRRAYNRGKVVMLRNALDLNYYKFNKESRQNVRQELGIEKDERVIGHIGRFQHQKNHEFLLKIFAALCEKNTDAVLLLVGEGELRERIRSQAKELGITERVVFAGVRADIPAVLSAMDVFVLPSFFEGMPNVVIEAQATGLPCVIADTITREANVTELVDYIPLTVNVNKWVDRINTKLNQPRMDAHNVLVESGYEIASATRCFEKYILEM